MSHDYEKNDSNGRPLRLRLNETIELICDKCHKPIKNGQCYWRDLQNTGPATHEKVC